MKIQLFLLAFIFILFVQCQTDAPIPKPRTYPKMEFPAREVTVVDVSDCPFTFEFPSYAEIDKNKAYFKEQESPTCWFNLHIPDFNADLFLSYHHISSRKEFDKLIGDTYKITNQINRRSDYMDEARLRNRHGVSGMKFNFEGPAASPLHFYLSDTTTHFLKGALYYNHRVRQDSILPATNFILEDVDRMLGTFAWR